MCDTRVNIRLDRRLNDTEARYIAQPEMSEEKWRRRAQCYMYIYKSRKIAFARHLSLKTPHSFLSIQLEI